MEICSTFVFARALVCVCVFVRLALSHLLAKIDLVSVFCRESRIMSRVLHWATGRPDKPLIGLLPNRRDCRRDYDDSAAPPIGSPLLALSLPSLHHRLSTKFVSAEGGP